MIPLETAALNPSYVGTYSLFLQKEGRDVLISNNYTLYARMNPADIKPQRAVTYE